MTDEQDTYDDTGERSLLGAVMLAPDNAASEFLSVGADAWFTPRARTLAAVISGMFKADEHISPESVLVSAQNSGLVPGKVDPRYLLECVQGAANPGSVPLIAKRIRDLADCRELHAVATRTAQRLASSWETGVDSADLEAHIAYLEEALAQIKGRDDRGGRSPIRRFGEVVDDFLSWLDAPPEQVRTIPTPWPDLNEVIAGGLHPGRSYLIAGRPGGGKSLALTNIGAHAAEMGFVGAIFSAEMGEMEVVGRIVASGGRAEYGQVTRRELDDYNRSKVFRYANEVHGMPLWVSDKSPISIDQIRSMARSLKRGPEGLDFVAVDYVQLLNPTDSKLHRERQIAEISWGLKTMAKELDIAVISACQLNRGPAKEKRPPTIAELRESGALEQDSDVVILLHHNLIDGQPTGEVEFIVGKNRTGKLTQITLPFRGYQARIG
ncbi:DnaB-like helicase C-terminal domain-containing protein [Nocardia sp. NPDC019255]|uniref:replicative DNA helicase n=1 Tax=Nocardia sp. NPDC019255 TaxID=3154591 RepID=UPI00340242C2